MVQRLTLILAFGGLSGLLLAQEKSLQLTEDQKREIKIDGIIGDAEWAQIAPLEALTNKWPVDTGMALQQSSIRIAYDEQFLYVSAINYQLKDNTIIQSLLRDNPRGHWSSDSFTVILDPLGLKSSGFLFGTNAGGAQLEATLSQGAGRVNFDKNWDNKWYSSVTQHEDYWVVEMAIPFNTLRFNPGSKKWRINFIRNDMYNNVYSTWARVPLAFPGIDLGYTGSLEWETPPRASKRNIALIPYTASLSNKDFEASSKNTNITAGLDAKVAVTSSLNLDLTVNPDFSNVAVDQQQTNLTQFSLFFPEQRPFFLENSDLFSNYGTWGITPFFSRTIGLYEGESVPINFGARLSGNLTEKLRVGIMDIQTRATDELPSSNYFVSSFQHQVWNRSRIKLLMTNRSSITPGESETVEEYSRSAGAEFDYTSPDGTLRGTAKYHLSSDPERLSQNNYVTIGSDYNNGKYYGAIYYSRVGKNYQPDMGFVPTLNYYDPVRDSTFRVGFQRVNGWLGYIIRPKNDKINSMDFNPWLAMRTDLEGQTLQINGGLWYSIQFQSRQSIQVNLLANQVHLLTPLDFTGENEPIPMDDYQNSLYRIEYSTDNRKALSGSTSIGYGQFYTGERIELRSSINVRKSPWGNFGVNYTMNKLNLGKLYGNTSLHLLGPTASISFTNNLFWTTFLQYNTQSNNFNINSRFQWRFKPMSDFFIVYGENYDISGLDIQNRSLVVKLNYWLNL
jgi:hypothetical protein